MLRVHGDPATMQGWRFRLPQNESHLKKLGTQPITTIVVFGGRVLDRWLF